MYIWQPTSRGEKSISGLPGRKPLISPDLQRNSSTKNNALSLFMVGFILLIPTLITIAKISQNHLP
jgi:hypothetical protein